MGVDASAGRQAEDGRVTMTFDAQAVRQAIESAYEAPTPQEREIALHALGYRIQRPSQRPDRMHAVIVPGGRGSFVNGDLGRVLEWAEGYESARQKRMEREGQQ